MTPHVALPEKCVPVLNVVLSNPATVLFHDPNRSVKVIPEYQAGVWSNAAMRLRTEESVFLYGSWFSAGMTQADKACNHGRYRTALSSALVQRGILSLAA